MNKLHLYLPAILLPIVSLCIVWHPPLQASAEDQALKKLGVTRKANSIVLHAALREAVRTHFQEKLQHYNELNLRIRGLEQCGFQKLKQYSELTKTQCWIREEDWDALSNLNNVIVVAADHHTSLSFNTLQNYQPEEGGDLSDTEWLAISELLGRCAAFLRRERENILNFNEYNTTVLRKKPLRPDIVFLPEMNLNNENCFLRLWYDTILLIWVESACLAHAAPETKHSSPTNDPPLLDWRKPTNYHLPIILAFDNNSSSDDTESLSNDNVTSSGEGERSSTLPIIESREALATNTPSPPRASNPPAVETCDSQTQTENLHTRQEFLRTKISIIQTAPASRKLKLEAELEEIKKERAKERELVNSKDTLILQLRQELKDVLQQLPENPVYEDNALPEQQVLYFFPTRVPPFKSR